MQPLFFVHIPKTAGTSFRLGASQYFTKERVVYDYGIKSGETSQLVQDCLYGEHKDWWRFNQLCRGRGAAMIGGHVAIRRFVSLFGVGNTITFLREPLQRVASEYAHFVRNYEYKGSFRDFYSRKVMQNRLTQMLRGVDLSAIGFVGLTECYEDSLKVLNAQYGTEIPFRVDNRGKTSLTACHEIAPEEEAELIRLNQQDIALYKRARALFDIRMSLHRAGLGYVHARLQKIDTVHVAGWAWWASGDDAPVEVEIYVNDACVGTSAAVDLRPGLCQFHPPRGGYVGFAMKVSLTVGDRVQCRVKSTGQRFPAEPYAVTPPTAK